VIIRINLITEKKKKKKKKKAQGPGNIKLVLIIANIAALLISGGAAYYFDSEASRLKAETESNLKTLASLNKKAEEVKKQEEMKNDMQRRSALIETLTKDQAIPVKVLDGVSTLMPDGVWLVSFNFNNSAVNLVGYAFSNNNIVAYVDNLKGRFNDVNLDETVQSVIEKTPVYQFRLRFNLRQ
jgi:Tfp pilus assembly protein PilN